MVVSEYHVRKDALAVTGVAVVVTLPATLAARLASDPLSAAALDVFAAIAFFCLLAIAVALQSGTVFFYTLPKRSPVSDFGRLSVSIIHLMTASVVLVTSYVLVRYALTH